MKIISGLRLFQDRDNELLGTEEFKKYYTYSIPPIYRLFQEQFNIQRECLNEVKVYNESADRQFNIAELSFSGDYSDYIGLYNLLSLTESIFSMKNSYSIDDEIHKKGYAIIGECMSNVSLLVGLEEENKDKIYIEDSNLFPSGERIVFISGNIFSFVKKISLVVY